ncbi:MAG: hypothetical protein UR26_C0006G0017 [candidate division TM6 bacterium GW2011_GWF2_32_72]|nr:MAG: hypothetical protein UR26_C0006G0017 [candidate division TM6 bacterium GW2011_GWF2_32_72]
MKKLALLLLLGIGAESLLANENKTVEKRPAVFEFQPNSAVDVDAMFADSAEKPVFISDKSMSLRPLVAGSCAILSLGTLFYLKK